MEEVQRLSLGLFHLSEFERCMVNNQTKTVNFRLNKKDYSGDWDRLIDRSNRSPVDLGFLLSDTHACYFRLKKVSDVYVTDANHYIHITIRTRSKREGSHVKSLYHHAMRQIIYRNSNKKI